MKLEQQVVSLGLAKKLKELGVKQESLYWWSEHTAPATLWSEKAADDMQIWDADMQYSAFTVAELGEMLPKTSYSFTPIVAEPGKSWQASRFVDAGLLFDATTEADARAKMLIYLIENGLYKPEQEAA